MMKTLDRRPSKSPLYTMGDDRPARRHGASTTRARRVHAPGPRPAPAGDARPNPRSWTSSACASARAACSTCCRAPTWRARTASPTRSSPPVCCTTSPWRASSRPTTATGARSWSSRTSTKRSAWAIRYHQALRFYPDESVGYTYPEQYVRNFGPDYKPEPYIEQAYKEALKHKWYMTSRQICVNDLYAFDPNVSVQLEDFEDMLGPQLPASPRRAWASTAAPWRTCGERSCGPPACFTLRIVVAAVRGAAECRATAPSDAMNSAWRCSPPTSR